MKTSANTAFPVWARPLALATAALFFISLAFPVTASVFKDTSIFPTWWGFLDVGLAFVLVILAFVIYGVAHGKVNKPIEAATYGAYRVLLHTIFVLLLIFFLAGDRITWINGLPGIAWRAWLLFYILPDWFAALGKGDLPEINKDG